MKKIKQRVLNEPLLLIFFFVYLTLTIFGVIHHEPWADEAQAWLMARDSSLFAMITHNLRYVGHPALWYLILMVPSRTLPYFVLGYVGVFFAALGVFVLYFYTDIPQIFKIIFSFSYFLFYQYAIVARSYVLLPLLFLSVAVLHHQRFYKPYVYVLTLSLLALTSIHGTLVALSIFGLYFLSYLRTNKFSREFLYSLFIFAIIILFVMYQIWPPSDLTFSGSYSFSPIRFIVLGTRISIDTFSANPYVSTIFIFTSMIWFKLRKTLQYFLVPYVSVLTFFSVKYYNSWHQGILVLIWICAYVISLKSIVNKEDILVDKYVKKTLNVMIFLVFGIQIFWSISAFRSDFKSNYSAGKDVANYLTENNLQDKKIYAVGYWTTSALPYFNKNIFMNGSSRDGSFWQWSPDVDNNPSIEKVIEKTPEVILVSRPKPDLTIRGYTLKRIFKGSIIWKSGIKENNDIAIFLKEPV